jgi:hypothetical protein
MIEYIDEGGVVGRTKVKVKVNKQVKAGDQYRAFWTVCRRLRAPFTPAS